MFDRKKLQDKAERLVHHQVKANVTYMVAHLNEDEQEYIRHERWKVFRVENQDEYGIDSDEMHEAFMEHCIPEWWIVSDSLGRMLAHQGHVAFPYGIDYLWGRPTSGQAIYMDRSIQEIAESLS